MTMPDFQQYIGVRYSGRKDPGDAIREIKVFVAVEDHELFREQNPGHESGGGCGRSLGLWVGGTLTG